MAIPVECQECHRSYKVDDKLAGKKVKCRNCGALLRVPGEEMPDDAAQQCLSCGKAFPRATRVCPHCGFNTYTGEREAVPAEDADAVRERKNQRWVRRGGWPLLGLLDQLVKVLLMLALLGGIAMTIVHIVRSPGGFSLAAVVPILVVVGAISAIMAPVSALAVNITVRKLKLAPREDTYGRVALCLLLPFSLAMLTGWPETAQWDWVAGLGWPLAILLLLYLLRGEVVEWGASLLAVTVAGALSLILVSLAIGAVNDMANGLYKDMLPAGPWTGLATGHSPPPKATIVKPVAPPATVVARDPTTEPTGAATVAATVQAPTTTSMAATTPTPTTLATASAPSPLRVASPFLAAVIDDPDLAGAFSVVAPPGAGDWMLALQNVDNNIEADRWSLNPLEKKEHYSSPNFPQASPQFSLSPKGDAVAVLSFLPRRHLEVFVPDNKALNRSVWLDLAANMPEGSTPAAVPMLLGVNDPGRVFLRWDMNGRSALQVFAAATPTAGTLTPRGVAIGPVVENCPAVVAPNGRITAVLGGNLVYFAHTDGTVPPRPFPVASDTNVRLLAMAFSPDSAQIAIYAAIAGLPTLTCYQVRNGEPVFTCLLSQTPLAKDAAGIPHRLLWLPGAQACLIDGNDLIDTATGKRFASLGLSSLADACVVGPSTLALTFKTAEGFHTVLGKLNDAKIRAAQPK